MIIAAINIIAVLVFFSLTKSSSDAREIVSDYCAMLGWSASYVAAHVGTYAGADKAGAGSRVEPLRVTGAEPLKVTGASAAVVRAVGGRYGEGVDGSLVQRPRSPLACAATKRADSVSSSEARQESLRGCRGWQDAPVQMWSYRIDRTYPPPRSGNRAER